MNDLSCPVCASRIVKVRKVTERILVAACPQCGAVVTINQSALTVNTGGTIPIVPSR